MFSKFILGKKYLQYLKSAQNGRGHGMHSPFVYAFIKDVLNDKKRHPYYQSIEALRRILKTDERVIEVEDFGAGSRVNPTNERQIKAIARSALKPKKYSRLLFRMVRKFKPKTILELGTCFGISTAYMTAGNKKAKVWTMEGAASIAEVARHNFAQLDMDHINLIEGNFDQTLPQLTSALQQAGEKLDFVFIDGNHRKEPTLRYYKELLPLLHEGSVMIFDDIHWSQEMEDAWATIRGNKEVRLSLDLFFIGIIFFRKENKVKQDFAVRF